jgi:hypothetical protein
MLYVFLSLGLIVFVLAVRKLRIVRIVRSTVRRAYGALAIMRDASVTERDRERAFQHAAVRVGIAFFDILIRSAVAFAVPLAGVYAGTVAGLYTTTDALAASMNPAFLIAITAFAVVSWRFVR